MTNDDRAQLDDFAAAAMQTLLGQPRAEGSTDEDLARRAYWIAGALMDERARVRRELDKAKAKSGPKSFRVKA